MPERRASFKCQVILATFGLVKEGLNVPTLTDLLLATPRKMVTQSVGRILRKVTEYPKVVVDIVDQHPVFRRQWQERNAFYKANGFHVYEINASNYLKFGHDLSKWKKHRQINKSVGGDNVLSEFGVIEKGDSEEDEEELHSVCCKK